MTTDQPAYRIEVRSGPLFGEEEIRSIEIAVDTPMPEMKASDMVESFREYYENRNEVTWEGEEVDAQGVLAGLAPDGVSYRIVVTPPLPVEAEPPTQPTLVVNDHDRIVNLEKRVDALEKTRSGRKGKPIVVSEMGVCGLDPERDSVTCPDASLYRRNQGCLGTACLERASKYYSERRAAKTA